MAVPIHILLVEDNRPDATLIKSQLLQAEQLKVDVEVAEWLNSAKMMLSNKRFDLVLLDLGLPDSQGIDTLTEVLKISPNVPVIVLSNREDLDTAILAVRAGAQSYIVKRSGLTVGTLEREIFYARERKSNDITSKRLTRASVASIVMPDDADRTSSIPVDAGMISKHIACIEDSVAKVRLHLLRNAPQQAEDVEQLLHETGFYVAVREIRSVLKLDEEYDARTRKISDSALQAVRYASLSEDCDAMSPIEAKEALLDMIGEGGSRV